MPVEFCSGAVACPVVPMLMFSVEVASDDHPVVSSEHELQLTAV